MGQLQGLVDRKALHRDVLVTMNPPETSAFWTVEEGRAAARRMHSICNSVASCRSITLSIGIPMLEYMEVVVRRGDAGWDGTVEMDEGFGEDAVMHFVELN
jgi:hypothetical protein